jgi:MFS transporter, DHA1 family, tetracycline resistance protein
MTEPAATIAAPAARKAGMPFIMATVLIDMVSIGLIIPVLAPLIGGFTASQAEQAFWYGVITIAFGIANFFGSPILGRLSDRYGRRPVLLLGFSGLALSFFVTGMATALWMLVVVRLFSGAMQSNIAVANAYVADITPPADRAKAFGRLGAMLGMGFILGPVIGGLLGGISLHLPFFVAGGLACVNWLYGYFVLPESLPLERRQPFVLREANPIASLRGLTALKGVGALVFVVALSGLAQFMTHTSWVLYTTFKFGWGPTENGWSLCAIGLMSVLVQGVFLGRLLKRFTAQRLAIMGLVSSSLCFVL